MKFYKEENQQVLDIFLVDEILNITKSKDYLSSQEKQARVKELEKEIDELVYKLYNLTYEEVKIIDSEIEKIISKEEYEKFEVS